VDVALLLRGRAGCGGVRRRATCSRACRSPLRCSSSSSQRVPGSSARSAALAAPLRPPLRSGRGARASRCLTSPTAASARAAAGSRASPSCARCAWRGTASTPPRPSCLRWAPQLAPPHRPRPQQQPPHARLLPALPRRRRAAVATWRTGAARTSPPLRHRPPVPCGRGAGRRWGRGGAPLRAAAAAHGPPRLGHGGLRARLRARTGLRRAAVPCPRRRSRGGLGGSRDRAPPSSCSPQRAPRRSRWTRCSGTA